MDDDLTPQDPSDPVAGVVRRVRRAQLAALGDDPTRRPPVVDGYATGRFLGAGGSSVVWSGTGVDGVERALKVLQPSASSGTTERDVLRELTLLRRVRHPRVVAVHDISRDAGGHPVLVLDLAAGGSLAAVLAVRQRLRAAEVTGLLAVLGPALEELHAAGVVHGDVAPGNVLLDARGEPLLADLGVSRALGHTHGSVLGTPGFADPAAVAGAGVSAASDVYGLAAVAWCALTGAPPVAGGAVVSRLATRRAGAELPTGTSAELLGVLREGLHRKPSRRPTPGELAQAAVACTRPRPVRPVTDAAPPRTSARASGPVVEAPAAPAPGPARTVTAHLAGERPPLPASARPSPPAPRRRARPAPRPRRRVLLPAGGIVLAVAVVAGVLLLRGTTSAGAGAGAPDPATTASAVGTSGTPAPQPSSREVVSDLVVPTGEEVLAGDDARAVVTELAARRAAALTTGDPAALTAVDVAGSTALAADEALVAEMATRRLVFAGLVFEVTGVVVEEQDAFRLVVRADVVTAAHELTAPDGTATAVAASAPRTSRLTLVRVGEQWRISEVG